MEKLDKVAYGKVKVDKLILIPTRSLIHFT